MAKYLYQASYTTEGVKGLLKDGGSRRREQIEKMTAGLGGTVEALYAAAQKTVAYRPPGQ